MTERKLAAKIGINRSLVGRKRRQGKSDAQIVAESKRRQGSARARVNTFADAQRRKEIAAAALKEIELQQRRGELISRKEVEDVAFRQARAERDALLHWVSVIAPGIAHDLQINSSDLQHRLENELRKFLATKIKPAREAKSA